MKLKWKICGMRDPDNIREVLTLSPDMMGFIFYPASSRYVGDLDPAQLPMFSHTQKVGVFVDASFSEIMAKVNSFGLQLVQLHGNEKPELLDKIKANSNVKIIKVFRISDRIPIHEMQAYLANSDYFLFDTHTAGFGGSGQKFDWRIIDNYQYEHPFFLSGGIGPDDMAEFKKIKHPALVGIDLNSRFEMAPGIKNSQKLKEAIQQL